MVLKFKLGLDLVNNARYGQNALPEAPQSLMG